MYKLNRIIPNITLAVLLAITVIVCLLFYVGGNVDPSDKIVADIDIVEPVYTDLLINYTYLLLVLTCIVTVASAIFSFATKIKSNLKSAMTSFIGIGSMALLLILTYALGDATPLNILGYEGQQTAFDLKLTDMCLYSSYILLGIAIIISVLSFFVKRII